MVEQALGIGHSLSDKIELQTQRQLDKFEHNMNCKLYAFKDDIRICKTKAEQTAELVGSWKQIHGQNFEKIAKLRDDQKEDIDHCYKAIDRQMV